MTCGSAARSAKAHSRNFLRLLGCRLRLEQFFLGAASAQGKMRNASAAEQKKNFNFSAHSSINILTRFPFLLILEYNNSMMKKFFISLFITLITLSFTNQTTEAKLFETARVSFSKNKEINNNYKTIKNLIITQNEFCNKRDYNGLYELYKDDFVNNDGFNKEIYFKLIKETWKSYPDIAYTTEIRSINLTNNFAAVETYENAVAITKEETDNWEIAGELHGFAHSVYYLEKVGKTWKIASENVLEEKTSLTYGDARYMNINLNSPEQIGAGQSYSANLTVDAPENAILVGSIGQEKITYPQTKSEEIYRTFSEYNTLERLFSANVDNTNEYNIAALGITRAELTDKYNPESINIYMSGIAFIITRVNVIPENKFIKADENYEQKDK